MNTDKKNNQFIGRRKTSTASLTLKPLFDKADKSTFIINGKEGNLYFQQNQTYLHIIENPIELLDLPNQHEINIKVQGGGLKAQAEAIRLALSRAFANDEDKNIRKVLKENGFLSRDARIKERRKYGLKKARKASQYSKR